jgi:hypothetical protein
MSAWFTASGREAGNRPRLACTKRVGADGRTKMQFGSIGPLRWRKLEVPW